MTRARPLARRLWEKIDTSAGPSGCWLWVGCTDLAGYGRIHIRVNGANRALLSHRIAYEFAVGQIPEGLHIDHICRVRACCNPKHLRPATPKQNHENVVAYTGSTTGVRGVHFDKRRCNYYVRVRSAGKNYNGGSFLTLEDAEAAAIALRNKLFTHNSQDPKEEL